MAGVDDKRLSMALGLIEYLEAEWAKVPGIVEAWPRLSDRERAAFVLEWPSNDVTLRTVERLAAEHDLGETTLERLRALWDLIATLRPALSALLAEDGTVRATS